MATMDWTEQMETVTKQWTDVQKQLWTSWGVAAQQATTKAQAKAVWQQMIDQWRNAVYRMLEMQVETTRLWSESVADADALEGMAQWAEQSYRMTEQWSKVQKQLWSNWFQLLEQVDPGQLPSSLEANNHPMMQFWNDMTQQASTMQQEWIKSWTAWQPSKKG